MKNLGIYIHIPFCRSKCQYCDFYSLTTKEDKLLDGFQDAVCAHIKETGLKPMARIIDICVAALDPTIMGYGPYYSTKKILERNNMTMDDIELIELNEDEIPAFFEKKDFASPRITIMLILFSLLKYLRCFRRSNFSLFAGVLSIAPVINSYKYS